MKYQHIAYYRNSPNGVANIDDEQSFIKELTAEEAARYIEYLEKIAGLKRHDNKSTFFYCNQVDARHSYEYIFYK